MFTEGNLLRTFVEIADCGNLTLAAARLNRSQSAISVQIRKLERELKTPVFLRDGKGMPLWNSGKTLLPVARRALAELAKVQSLFETPLKRMIRAGIPDDFAVPQERAEARGALKVERAAAPQLGAR